MRIVVLGNNLQSYVAASLFSSVGNEVVMPTESRIPETVKQEMGLIDIYSEQLNSKRLIAVPKLSESGFFDFVVVAGESLENVGRKFKYLFSDMLSRESCVILLTPTKVGEAESFNRKLNEQNIKIFTCVVPILLREGRAIQDFTRPSTIIVGSDEPKAHKKVEALFHPFNRVKNVVKSVSTKEAEFAAFATHAMLATRLSFMNEMASLAERSQVDIEVVRECMGMDPRVGHEYLYPGCGYGGETLEKNVEEVANQLRLRSDDLGLLNIVAKINERQKDILFRKIWNFFHAELSGKRIAIWGASFKPGSARIEGAPSISLISSLISHNAQVSVYDPLASDSLTKFFNNSKQVQIVSSATKTIKNADVLAICTEWKEFWNPDFELLSQSLKYRAIFDGRNILNPKTVENFGIKYFGVGRGLII